MRSSGGGAPITVPARRVRRLWIAFLAIVAVMLIEAAVLGFAFYRLNRVEKLLSAKQTETKELYINLARQNEQIIGLKKLVPSGSAAYLASQPQPAVVSALPQPAPTAAAAPVAVPASAVATAPASQPGPMRTSAAVPALPAAVKPVATAAPVKPAPVAPPKPSAAVKPPAPPADELVKLLDLKMAGGQISLRLKRSSGELASGYMIAVFSGGGDCSSYPTADLKRGEPIQGRQGLDFNVRNYRLISFDAPGSSWRRLTFYVYDSRGRLKQRQAFSKEQLRK